ncbi:MAG: AGE family epimerase/isomerase [Treponema sp.]|nr:AGE family epimerase/isomerase [Spirochaetia bacterium]MDD7458352.1 AGE family epimerase/isomerase [Spirochaetales bacterium]MDY5810687.1 AGE family epimerase/isomerase [Treponema sp.]MEE1181421.1 AGE family epimerase/isomerase [Treponema sp.]
MKIYANDLNGMKAEIQAELKNHIIPFWEKLKDNDFGGFYGLLDYNLNLDKKAPKGCILNSRILWFFSNAYKLLEDKELALCANHAWNFLNNYCMDKENGGIFWSLNYDGSVLDSTKHTYNQAFALYALSSFYEITKNKDVIKTAESLFNTIEEKCCDAKGYLEAFTKDFKPESNEKLSENGVLASRTMNTTLHVLEAYTEYYRVTKNAKAKERLIYILNLVADKIWNADNRRQKVFMDDDYNSIIDLYSYGHDIESSWLIDRALEVLNVEELTQKLTPITKAMAEHTFEVAYKNHSMMNECEKGVDNEKRVWWIQAETVVGFMNEFQKSGDEKFLRASLDVWEYIKKFIIDKREGSEWFWAVDKDGNPDKSLEIVEPWKCPYHNGRMCFEIINRIK